MSQTHITALSIKDYNEKILAKKLSGILSSCGSDYE
jgi:hypothetical protein